MNQWYKPNRDEFRRLSNLPFFLLDGKKIHYDKNNWYELDGTDMSVICWETAQ